MTNPVIENLIVFIPKQEYTLGYLDRCFYHKKRYGMFEEMKELIHQRLKEIRKKYGEKKLIKIRIHLEMQ